MLGAVASVLGWLLAILSIAGVIYTAMTGVFVLRFFKSGQFPLGETWPVPETDPDATPTTATILKPLHGAEAGLRQNLAAHFFQNAHNPIQIIFGVQNPADPAIAIAQDVIAAHPEAAAQLAIGDGGAGANRKVANLIQMGSHATGEVLILCDSDIGPPPDHVAWVLAALAEPDLGIVTCPYYGRGETGIWSVLAAMGLSYQFMPSVITGVSLGMAKPCMGSTIALRPETLTAIGGFEAFRDVLADDYAMGAAVRALGQRSMVAPVLVSHSCTEASLAEVFAHELRWARTVRGVDPAGHGGSVVTHPVPLALLALLLLGLHPFPVLLLGAAIGVRVMLGCFADRVIGRRSGSLWVLPLRDMLSFAVFVGSFLGRAVVWRGEKFHVTTDGDLSPV